MIEAIAAAFLVVAFAVLLKVLRVVEQSRQVIGVSRMAVTDLTSSALDDDEKERAMKAHTKALGNHSARLIAGIFGAILVPLAVVWPFDYLGVLQLEQVLNYLLSWQFIVVGSVLMILVVWAGRQKKGV